ncbi:hypothetical protein ACVWW1_002293 [Bradyrhizobium sp. JR3.5]
MRPAGGELEERVVDRAWVVDQLAGLAEIVQHQRGQADGEPREPDRKAAEMPHVGIHRLTAGDGEERGTEDREADVKILMDQEIERIERAQCDQHAGRLDDAVNAQRREHGEPEQHHRAEDLADEAGALLLHEEQADQDHDGERHHRRRQRGRVDLQAFDRRQHGNGRRDRAVAIEQGGADQADNQQMRAPGARRRVACREQRQ